MPCRNGECAVWLAARRCGGVERGRAQYWRAAIAIAAILAAAPATAQRASAVHKGQETAVAWLDLLDSGEYGASWDQAAYEFRASVSRPEWEAAMRSQRAPLGPVRARRLKWAKYTETLPIPPSGQYVILEYETRFDNRASVVETVTPVQDPYGVWRVGAYHIR